MASKSTVRIEELGSAMGALVKRMAAHNREVVLGAVAALPYDAERAATEHYPRVLGVVSGQLKRDTAGFSRQSGNYWTIGLRNTKEYAIAQHEGSAPHVIRAKKAKALWWPGAAHPVKAVNHPGNKATHFLADPLRAEGNAMVERLVNEVGFGDG